MCGKMITSRIDCLFVNNITNRSIPMPIPAAGGMPYDNARNVIFVHQHRLFIATFALLHLFPKPFALLHRIVQLRKPIRYLHPRDVQLKPLRHSADCSAKLSTTARSVSENR